jgi:Leishmanolysin
MSRFSSRLLDMRLPVVFFLSAVLWSCSQPSEPFEIGLQFSANVAPRFRGAFETAAQRWQGIITSGYTDIKGPVDVSDCLDGATTVSDVDDVVILVETFDGDGAGGLLGQAGPCFVRVPNGLTLIGVMRFDNADLDRLAQASQLSKTIIHEMGHVLGIGTLWESKGLVKLANPNRDPENCDTDPQYVGAKGKLEWQKLGRSGNVPLEKGYGTGTCEGHWDEAILKNELMTGFLDDGANPLSRLSIASLEDLGYSVNYAPADAYKLLTAPIQATRLEPEGEHQHTELLKPIGVINDR